jgi:hypothetical protein
MAATRNKQTWTTRWLTGMRDQYKILVFMS